MKTQIETLHTKLLERKSWLDALQKLNDVSINQIALFKGIDSNYAIDTIGTNEVEYQELLFLLRGVQLTQVEINVKPFDANMYGDLNDTKN